MISVSKIKYNSELGFWYYSGSSEVFDTREEALKSLKKLSRKGIKRGNAQFYSERLKMTFRSSWEVELAELMTELGIRWEFEPRRIYFRAEKESYLPDFWLPDYNCWIEVKGYMDKKSEKRCKLFRKHYGAEYGYLLYMKEERELVLKSPETLFVLLNASLEELKRRKEMR